MTSTPSSSVLETQPLSKRKSVFVVSPIGAPGSDVYRKSSYALKYIFREALQGDEWDVHRADEGESPDSIGQHVIRKLWEADLVIADLTGHNPNVFYELAIAHGWRKPVVHLIAKGEPIPFDIVDQRTIFYDITDLASVEKTVGLLRKYAEYAMDHVDELITPLTSFEKFSHIRNDSADGGGAVASLLEEVVRRLSRLEHGIIGQSSSRQDEEPRRPIRKSVTEVIDLLKRIERIESDPNVVLDVEQLNVLKEEVEDYLSDYPVHLREKIFNTAMRTIRV